MDVEVGAAPSGGPNLDRFFVEIIKSIKSKIVNLKKLHRRLAEANESFRSLRQPFAIRYFRTLMDSHVASALRLAESVKLKLQALDHASAPGHRIRTSVIASLHKKLGPTWEAFASLRMRVSDDYRQAVGRDYTAVTGSAPEEAVLNDLMASGEAERFLGLVVLEQGGTREAMDVVGGMGERYASAREVGGRLLELERLLMDAVALVEANKRQVGDHAAAAQVEGASSSAGERAGMPRAESSNRAGYAILVLAFAGIMSVLVVWFVGLENKW